MDTVTAFSEHLMRYLWSVSWQVSILIGVIIIIERFYSQASPLLRYLLLHISVYSGPASFYPEQ